MASERIFDTSDLRSEAQDSKRDAARRHKWALGGIETVTRPGNPRPQRPVESSLDVAQRKFTKSAIAHSKAGGRASYARRDDVLDATSIVNMASDASDSNSDFEDHAGSPPADAAVMYSFDAARGPSHGSQILNLALAKAEQKFKDKETVMLVKSEYDVLDADGESVGLTPVKRGKAKAKDEHARGVETDDDDNEYEFV